MLLLARVLTRLGTITEVTPAIVENLYATDFDHLQRLYERINTDGDAVGSVTVPVVLNVLEVDLSEIDDGRPEG